MPQTLNIAVCEDEAAETVLLCDILNHSDNPKYIHCLYGCRFFSCLI